MDDFDEETQRYTDFTAEGCGSMLFWVVLFWVAAIVVWLVWRRFG